MSSLPSFRLALLLAILPAAPLGAQSNAERALTLQGAWSAVETSSPRTFQMVDDQPGYRLFVDGHFAVVRVNGLRERAPVEAESTAVELWNTLGSGFTAQAGAYEVRGDSLITRTRVSKDPSGMAEGTFNVWLYRMSGDSLWITRVATQAGPVSEILTGLYVRMRPPSMPTN